MFAAAVGLSLSFLRSQDQFYVFFGWFLVAACLLGLIRISLEALNPARLILSPDGFEITGVHARPLVSWADVDGFRAIHRMSGAYVYFARKGPRSRTTSSLRTAVILPSTADGWLPTNLRLPAEELAALMEEWKARYGA
jgi:hypothetical protein